MIPRVIRFSGPLLDHDPFGIARAASHLGIHVILPIAASWQASLTVLKVAPSHIAWKGHPSTFLEQLEEVTGFLRRYRGWRIIFCPCQGAERGSERGAIA